MAHGENAIWRNVDLWGKKPLSMWCKTSSNKKLSRRIYRRSWKKREIKQAIKDEGL